MRDAFATLAAVLGFCSASLLAWLLTLPKAPF